MAVMALREFECTLCGQRFKRYSGDLILPGPRLCDACLKELWQLDDSALRARVSHYLAERASSGDKGPEWQNGVEQLEDRVIRIVLGFKQSGKTIKEIIQD